MKFNKILTGLFLMLIVVIAGCGSIDINTAINKVPAVKTYLENNPDFNLQIVHYSLEESAALSGEFKANCGKDLVQKDIYRFIVNDGKSFSGVGYFDLNNEVLECFKKNTGNSFEVTGENVDATINSNEAMVVDKVIVSSEGKVVVGNDVNVEADGSVKVGNIVVDPGNVVQVGDSIKVDSDGSVKVGDSVYVDGNGNVNLNMEDLQVDINDGNVNVNTGGVEVNTENGNVDVNTGDSQVNVENGNINIDTPSGQVNVDTGAEDPMGEDPTDESPMDEDPDMMIDDDDEEDGTLNVEANADGTVNVNTGDFGVEIN